jgi:peptide/nickel transport system substrate-binding protein
MDAHTRSKPSVSRRDLLRWGGAGLAATAVAPAIWTPARAQAPKRGGTLSLRLWDPPHFDPHLTISYKTHIVYSFTHSRLVKQKAGPGVQPGTFPIEGDLAESWTQPNETAYVFKLRKGVRWHNKPPVNGRELTADDVVYTVERFRMVKGNANAYMLKAVDRVEAQDRYTVKFTLTEPFAWFLDMLANPMAVAIIARECVEKFGAATALYSAEADVARARRQQSAANRPRGGRVMARSKGCGRSDP